MKKLIKFAVSIITLVLFFTSISLAKKQFVPIIMDDMITFSTYNVVSSMNNLEVPTFDRNSQGKLVIQCEDDVVYYIMAYDCLRQDTNPSVTTDNGIAVTDEKKHMGEVFYVKGHTGRTGGPVTIKGHVYSGGKDLYEGSYWTKTCP